MTQTRRRTTKLKSPPSRTATTEKRKARGTLISPAPGVGKEIQQYRMDRDELEEYHSASDGSNEDCYGDEQSDDDNMQQECQYTSKENCQFITTTVKYARTTPIKKTKSSGFHNTIMSGLRKYLRKNCYGKHKFIRNDAMAYKFISRAAVSGDVMIPSEYTERVFMDMYQNRMYKAMNDLRHNGQSLARTHYMGTYFYRQISSFFLFR